MSQEQTTPVSQSRNHRKLQALKILLSNTYDALHIAKIMLDDNVFTNDDMEAIKTAYDRSEELFIRVEKYKKAGKLDLVHYEWSMLPNISVKISIVGPAGMREFSYGEV